MKRSDHLFDRFKIEISVIKSQKTIEKYYYEGLGRYLREGQFKSFIELFNASIDFDIFLDTKKIPDRFESISKLLLSCTERISNGYETSALGDQINILRFCNEYNLLEKDLNGKEKESVEKLCKNRFFISNLEDLFGKVSESFITYLNLVFPRDLYDYFMSRPKDYFTNRDELMYYIKNNFFDHYTIYGLSVRNLGSIKKFIKSFKDYYQFSKNRTENKLNQIRDIKFIEFNINYITEFSNQDEYHEYREIKKHLVSTKNIFKNLHNILSMNEYKFYSISMVLLGGLGPQGLGFTYSTPRGEIIEICSDQKETEAIIIQYKQYLKRKFINKLDRQLISLNIGFDMREKIIIFLSEILKPSKLIGYNDKDSLLMKIKNFLFTFEEFQQDYKSEIKSLISKIANAVSIILREIKLKDQFKTRMDLVAENKIKSEDIAKLTSLNEKSHSDVLRERFFFQYIVNWLYEIYINENA